MSERLVIIDGKSVFYRGYYAMPNLSTKDGTPTGGVYGFAVLALEVVKRLQPDYVVVAWDKAKTNIRSRVELYSQYKANRKPAPPDFYEQIPLLHDLLESLHWPLYEADDLEADDIMGAFSKQAKEKGIESYLITSDLDVLQLVNSHTHIYTLKKGLSNIELFNEASFKEKYGIDAHQWIDTKALKGDSSDNVPGVGGVGEKTALDLISKYETLDGVYAHLDELKPALRAKLEKDRSMAYLSKKLVTLMCDADIRLDFDQARLDATVPPEFIQMLRKLEFRGLLSKVESVLSEQEIAEAESVAEPIAVARITAFTALDFMDDQPRVIALNPEATELWASRDPEHVAIIPIEDLDQNTLKTLTGGPVVGHDLKSLFRALLAQGLDWPGDVAHDTRVAAFLINPLERSRELADLMEQTITPDETGKITAAIWKLYDRQKSQLAEMPKVEKLSREIEFPMVYLLACIEHRGILLDSGYLNEMSRRFESSIKQLEQSIYEHAGQEFNIGSPSQLGMILFDKLGLPTAGVKKGKTGYSTGANELDKLRPLHPVINLITEYREQTKLKSTYIDALPKLVDHQGRLHTTFSLDVAATGRLSSKDPNLQNIPTRTELGQAIRTAFTPAEGNVFVSADYSQFELRLAAVLAGDQQMIEDFNKDIDIHAATAAQIYGLPLDEVTKDMRRRAKTINFGVLYGMSPHGLSVATSMSLAEAKDFITKYFELRAAVRQYIDATVENALKAGFVETLFGRRRPTPDLKSSNWVVREAAKRAAANMPIQGTEADLMKLAMLKVEERLKETGLGEQILQIHDSIMVECPAQNAEKVSQLLKETMENIYLSLGVKLKVDTTTGRTWGEL